MQINCSGRGGESLAGLHVVQIGPVRELGRERFVDAAGGCGSGALVDGECLLKEVRAVAGVPVVQVAAACSF